MTDAEYEAELQARTPEEWVAMKEKALVDEKDILALQHLMWRRDVEEWEHITSLLRKPDMSLEDKDYALRQIGEIAETLRAARGNPEKRERNRWFNVLLCASMVASSKESLAQVWLKDTLLSFPATRGPQPGKDAPPLAHAIYAVERLLDALLMKPEDRAELEAVMNSRFRGWCHENDIGVGRIVNGQHHGARLLVRSRLILFRVWPPNRPHYMRNPR